MDVFHAHGLKTVSCDHRGKVMDDIRLEIISEDHFWQEEISHE